MYIHGAITQIKKNYEKIYLASIRDYSSFGSS